MCHSESEVDPKRDADPNQDADPDWDATFLNTRREAKIIFGVWVVALLWSVPMSYLLGYGTGAGNDTIIGIPSWVFWGIAAPWSVASVFAVWFSMFRMVDDDLGRAPEEEAI
jgi:hypothetical protein